jgi:benzaldehyde dehydrogenase (NAD)
VPERGGKLPLVVLDDADLAAAVNGAAFGALANSGQICISTERLIVAMFAKKARPGKLKAAARRAAPRRCTRRCRRSHRCR